MYTCIAGVSALVLLIGKFCQFSTELSACHTSIFLFLYYDLSKYEQIFTKLGMCIDIVETFFGSLFVGKFCQFLTVICLPYIHISISGQLLEEISMDFSQTWYAH